MISFVSGAQLQIVGHCKGLPLALEVVGRSLHGRPVEIWRSRLKKLSEGQSIVNSETDLRKCLQSSLDALNEEDVMLKECFMDLGSFPEDQKIPATALIDMWAELYNLDKDGVDAIANLHQLSSRTLLNLAVTRYTDLLFVFKMIVFLLISLSSCSQQLQPMASYR